MDTVIELAKHAQKAGADYIVVHAPVLHFLKAQDETLFNYYSHVARQVDIGIALWSHPDSGYLMSPQLCARLAEIPNVVAIKYSVPRPMYSELTRLAGDNLIVSTASEEEWFDNIVELKWQVYLCSNPPFLGRIDEAKRIRDSLEPVREAFKHTRPAEKPHAHAKYWQDCLGQTGGEVRMPMLGLNDTEKGALETAIAKSGLKLS